MLLPYKSSKPIKSKLPKLKVAGSTSKREKAVVDDTLEVTRQMQELFSKYDWKVVTTKEDLIAYISTRNELGIDTETTGKRGPFKDSLVGFSLGTPTDCIYIPLAHKVGTNYTGDLTELVELLKYKKLYGFNAKFDLKMLLHPQGIDLKEQVKWDGYLASRVNNSAEKDNELKCLYVKYIDPSAEFYSFKSLFKMPFANYDPLVVGGYAGVDAMKHIALGQYQEQHLGSAEKKLMNQLEMPLMRDLVDIELTGIALNVKHCKQLEGELQTKQNAVLAEIQKQFPDLNPASPVQVAKLLYDDLKLPKIFGRETGEQVLKMLRQHHPVVDLILEYRYYTKHLSTYAGKMPLIADDGIIHTTYNQIGADTGRFSSTEPNLQNIPKENQYRAMFRAREGCMLVSCDYTQQEVYVLASLADDESMKNAYNSGMDFYAYMASIVFDTPYEQCCKTGSHHELRNQMKSVVLGLNYDMGLPHLAEEIGKTVQEAKEIYEKFFLKCPKVKEFRNRNLEFAKQHGYVETILGRKRYFRALNRPDFECDNKEILEAISKLKNNSVIKKLIADAEKEGIKIIDNRSQKINESRQVVNSIIQGSSADMTKLAMIQIAKDERVKQLGGKLLLQIHDEVICEFPEATAEEGGKVVSQIMVDVGSSLINLKMKCDPTVMKVWQKD